MDYDKLIFSRLRQSFLWTLALHIFPLSFFIILTNLDAVHPADWIFNSTRLLLSFKTWFSLVPLYGVAFLIAYVLSLELKEPPLLLTTRFQVFCSFFTRNNAVKLLLYVLLGFILPVTYLSIIGETFTLPYAGFSDKFYLNECSVFVATCAVWTSIYYFVRFDLLSEKYLQFPVIRQVRFLQIKSKFHNVFHNCFKSSLLPVFYYVILYFWYQKHFLSLWEGLTATFAEKPIPTSEYLSFQLLLKAWLISSIYLLVVETVKLMIEIHFTEHFSFSLLNQCENEPMLLSNALAEDNLPIIQHLACYDLYTLSTGQMSLRWQVFTLSQPGGHPYTWNTILCESLKIIDKFICEVQEALQTPEPVKQKPPVPKHYHMRDMTPRHEEIFSGPVPLPPNRIRNLVEHPHISGVRCQQPSALEELWTKLENYSTTLKQNTVTNYIFGSKPDAKITFLVTHSQPLIWVVQSIAELSANALLEDQFGIALKDLPIIINTLLRLRCSLEKIANLQKKFQKRDHEQCMKASLKSAVKRSLYRIAIAYSDYFNDLPLSPENLSVMKNFVNFKEC